MQRLNEHDQRLRQMALHFARFADMRFQPEAQYSWIASVAHAVGRHGVEVQAIEPSTALREFIVVQRSSGFISLLELGELRTHVEVLDEDTLIFGVDLTEWWHIVPKNLNSDGLAHVSYIHTGVTYAGWTASSE